MSASSQREWAYRLAAPCLLLLVPFLVYLKHGGYGLLRAETLLAAGAVVAFGLGLGLVMVLIRWAPVVPLVMALLMAFVLDMQVTGLGPRTALASLAGFGCLSWLLRRHVTRLATVMASVMLLTTLFVPGGHPVSRHGSPADVLPARSDQPFLLHLLLDEHIGIEGIPAEFDPDGRLAAELRDFFLANGFEVYGRAYSRYFNTEESVSNMFNFAASAERSRYFAGEFVKNAVLAENAWFDRLRERGYRLHIVQNDYLRYVDASAPERSGDSVVDYTLETIASIEDAPLASLEKARFLIGIYLRLNDTYTWGLYKYTDLRTRLRARGVTLPFWRESYDRTSAVASRTVFAELREDLRHAGPGRMYFAHLMLPHFPYTYQADGRMRPHGGDWLFRADRTKAPRRNDDVTRANSYRQYLEQVRFTRDELDRTFAALREAGQWDDAVVIVHGDHGSRITVEGPLAENRERLSDADLVDGYSTLFAIKRPGHPARYDRRLLPLDHLAARILRDGADPGDQDLESRPAVLLVDRGGPLVPVPLPAFGRDLGTASSR